MNKHGRGRPDLVSDALRQLWSSAEEDPVPDDFLELLDQLEDMLKKSDTPGDPGDGGAGGPA